MERQTDPTGITPMENQQNPPQLKKQVSKNSPNIFLEEFLIIKNREDEMDLYINEKKFKDIDFEIRKDKKPCYIIGKFNLESIKERKGIFLEIPKYVFILSDSIFEKFGKSFNSKSVLGKFKIEFSEEDDEYSITEFEEIKFEADLKDWIDFRKKFTFSEWVNELLKIVGIDGKNLLFREKIIILARFLPMIENNFYYMEFGDHSIGKTTFFDKFPNNAIIKNINATATDLVYDNRSKTNGLIFKTDTLIIDEAKNGKLNDDFAIELQIYLSSNKIRRGDASEQNTKTSFCFLGNCDIKNARNIFRETTKSLCEELTLGKDTFAMFDRFHYLNPSWGMRRLDNDKILLDTDNLEISRVPISYFSEIIKKLRNYENFDIKELLHKNEISFTGDLRGCNSILKTASGFLKLLFPDLLLAYSDDRIDDIFKILVLGTEGRFGIDNSLKKYNKKEVQPYVCHKKGININFDEYLELLIFDLENITFNSKNAPLIHSVFSPIIKTYWVSPHRVGISKNDNFVEKYALDAIGIKENEYEAKEIYAGNKSSFEFSTKNNFISLEIKKKKNPPENPFTYFESPTKNYLYGYEKNNFLVYQDLLTGNLACYTILPKCCDKTDFKNISYEIASCNICGKRYTKKGFKEIKSETEKTQD